MQRPWPSTSCEGLASSLDTTLGIAERARRVHGSDDRLATRVPGDVRTTLVLIGWVVGKVPNFAGYPAAERQRVIPVFLRPGIRPILAVIFLWMTVHNILYTYVAPYAERVGIAGHVDRLLLGFGLAALAGIWIAGVAVDVSVS